MQSQLALRFSKNLLYAISEILTYIYVLAKIYRVLCFTKIIFDQLPLFNPYRWPLSFIRVVTKPYFDLWERLLPTLKFGKFAYDISGIVGIEFLSFLIASALKIRTLVLLFAEKLVAKL